MSRLSDRQLQIIDAAIELISEKSIQELTIKNLAKKIGFTEGAVYRHFGSKTDILLAILNQFQQDAAQILDKVCTSEKSAPELIEDIFLHHFRYFTKRPAVTAVIFSESIFQNESRLSDGVSKLLNMHEEALSCILKKGQDRGEINKDIRRQELIRIVIGSIRYTVTSWRISRFNFDLMQEGKRVVNAIIQLIKT
ncbi:MAG TPA: TetR/AcrR family transcriptional regulator [Caldithrix abyssi]|uniref:TetR/AcrR family transcriptional regulator n=1 Tax=Caldithrix abyssi TaxID=187145 RepID=A0A7V4WW43_CALAY|nr:TetR/AcrR family transcriptional regulator [Caldithrix abyssi]